MDELKLLNGSRIPIEDGASLGHIEHIAPNEAEALTVCEWLTPENCSHVEFYHDNALSGSYDNVIITDVPSRTTLENDTVLVAFGFRELSDVEIRVGVLEEEMIEVQEAIVEG